MKKRMLSLLLALVMITGMLPLNVFAAEGDVHTITFQSEGGNAQPVIGGNSFGTGVRNVRFGSDGKSIVCDYTVGSTETVCLRAEYFSNPGFVLKENDAITYQRAELGSLNRSDLPAEITITSPEVSLTEDYVVTYHWVECPGHSDAVEPFGQCDKCLLYFTYTVKVYKSDADYKNGGEPARTDHYTSKEGYTVGDYGLAKDHYDLSFKIVNAEGQPGGEPTAPGTVYPVLIGNWTLIAQYTPVNYKVKIGEETIANYTIEQPVKLPPVPESVPVGHSFAGWKPVASVGNWDANITYEAEASLSGMYGDVTLEPVWDPVSCTAVFRGNGGEVDSDKVMAHASSFEVRTDELNNTVTFPYSYNAVVPVYNYFDYPGKTFSHYSYEFTHPDGTAGEPGTVLEGNHNAPGSYVLTAQWKNKVKLGDVSDCLEEPTLQVGGSVLANDGLMDDGDVVVTIKPKAGHNLTVGPTVKANGNSAGNVVKNNDGTYTCTISVDANTVIDVEATGIYEATGDITFAGNVTINGRALTADDVFTFVVKEGETTVATGQNDATGVIEFTKIQYDLDDVGTHTYTVACTSTGGNGLTVDTTVHTVTVDVTDNGNGTLTVTPSNNCSKLDFTFVYEVDPITGSIPVQVNLDTTEVGKNHKIDLENSKVTVTLTAEDGIPMPQPASQEVKLGESVSFGTITFSKPGSYTYKLTQSGTVDGVDLDGEKTVTVTVTDNGNGTLTAAEVNAVTFNNKAKVYTATFHATLPDVTDPKAVTKSGLDGIAAGQQSFTVTYGYGGSATVADYFVRPGYEFVTYDCYDANGYDEDEPDFGTAANQTYKDLVRSYHLYAKWTANSYTVKFDANGGTGSTMADQSMTYDVEMNLPKNGFTRTGYAFNGWNTEKDGSGTAYADEAKVKNLTTENGKEVVLYAQWKANEYTVVFHANDGTETNAKQTFSYDVAQKLTANSFRKEGHTFISWNTKADGTGDKYADEAEVKNLTAENGGTINLYAQWSRFATFYGGDEGGLMGTTADGKTRFFTRRMVCIRSESPSSA